MTSLLTARFAVFLTTIPTIFQEVYHQKLGISGLHYLAFGLGLILGAQINLRFLDYIYKRLKDRNGGVGRPEFRLRKPSIHAVKHSTLKIFGLRRDTATMLPGTILMPIGLFIAGWAARPSVHWIVVDIVSSQQISLFSFDSSPDMNRAWRS